MERTSNAVVLREYAFPGLYVVNQVKTRFGVRYPRDCCTGRRPTGIPRLWQPLPSP